MMPRTVTRAMTPIRARATKHVMQAYAWVRRSRKRRFVAAIGPRGLEVITQPSGADAPVALVVTSPDWPCLMKYVDANGFLTDTLFEQTIADWGHGLCVWPGHRSGDNI